MSIPPVASSASGLSTSVASELNGVSQASPTWFKDHVQPHEVHLRNYLRSAFPSVRDVDDVVQESFLRVWRAKATQPIRSIKAFLFHAARNLAIDTLRRNSRSPIDPVSDVATLDVLEDVPDTVDSLGIDEKLRILADAVTRLPPRCREVFVGCKFKGLSHSQVAAQMGISERTVDEQIFRGYRKINDEFRRRGIVGLFE